MVVEAEIFINASKNSIWNCITNIQNAAKFISGIEKIEIVDEPANNLVGLRWRETRMYFGKPAAIEKWITEAVSEKYYKTKAEMDGFVFVTTMAISEVNGKLKLISTHDTQPQGMMAKIKSLPMIFFKGIIRKAILQDLSDIKSAVEQK